MKKIVKLSSWVLGIFAFSMMYSMSLQAQNSPKLTDPQIASVAVTANQIDVNYAAIAIKKSTNKEIIQFAKTMKNDHNAVIDMCVKLVTKLNVKPESNEVTKSLLAGETKTKALLNKVKKGVAFDKAYINNEVAYHESVIGAVETVLIPQAQNKELKDLLLKVLPSLKIHLEHAKMVQKNFK